MASIKITIPEVEYHVSPALIDGLRFLGSLTRLNLTLVPASLRAPLSRLFALSTVRSEAGGRDRHLPQRIRPIFNDIPEIAGWVTDTDLKHTIASFSYLAAICAGEQFTHEESKVVLSAIIVHDCAYPKVSSYNEFTSGNTRLLHMMEGEKEFSRFAEMINAEFPGFYTLDEVETIRSIIRQHDNPSIRQNGSILQFDYVRAAPKLIWSHREADRLWMLDKGGFALDLTRRLLEANPWYHPANYLDDVVKKHIKEANAYVDNESCRIFRRKKSFYRTDTGFNIFKRLIKERIGDYQLPMPIPRQSRSKPPNAVPPATHPNP